MKKFLLATCILLSTFGRAEEGMWIPSLLQSLNESDMKTMGMRITADDIYSINHSSIKDAIVQFNGGCTAEVISDQGLILTNHHCGYSAINAHSTQEHNYLEDGFWAMTKADELANPGMTCTFIIKIEDVTDELMSVVNEMKDGAAMNKAFVEKYNEIKKREEQGHYKAVIKPFNYGNSYFVIVTETFEDIRLVGTPPDDVGKFGGNTDNWVWPRHTGDFSIFRIYAGKDNKPASYSEDNKPFKPRHSLPVSMERREEGQFTMVYGFPGSTEQFLISDHVDYLINSELPERIAYRDIALDNINGAIRVDQKKDKSARKGTFLKYASKEARIANAWKKWIGQIQGLKSYNALHKKKELESEYQKLAFEKEEFKPYRNVIQQLKDFYKEYDKLMYELAVYGEFTKYSGPEIIRHGKKYLNLLNDTLEADVIEEMYVEKYLSELDGFFSNYDEDIDRAIFKGALTRFLTDPKLNTTHLPISTTVIKAGELNEYVDALYDESLIGNKTNIKTTLNKFSKRTLKKLKKDDLIKLIAAMDDYYSNVLVPKYREMAPTENQLMQVFVKGLMEMMPNKTYWYDANFTLRLTYGKVEGSAPRDGMEYKYYTTMDGVLAKYDPDNIDFQLPEKLVELGRKRDYGPYAQDGELFVCFTGSNHTTGGNSGSPCLNGDGHLIGLNFDRSWESTMSDIMFDPNICRNIMVDIRYVLFIVDKYAGAKHLIDEMELVTPEWREAKQKERYKAEVKRITEEGVSKKFTSDLLVERAAYYDSLGLVKEANLDIEASLKLDNKHAKTNWYKASMLFANDKDSEALKILNNALRYNSSNTDLRFLRGVINVELHQYLNAAKDFDVVIEQLPTHFKAYYNRGVAYHRSGKYDKACADFKMAQSLGNNSTLYIYESACK